MPYATPADPSSSSSVAITATVPMRLGHRRTRSSFSDERGPGAFASLGTLPRRRHSSNNTNKKPLFHFNVEDESPPEGDDQASPSSSPPSSTHALSIDTGMNGSGAAAPTNSLRLSIENGRFSPSVNPPSHIELPKPHSVPFPKSSPLSPSPSPPPSRDSVYESPFIPSPASSSSSLPRTPSTPIILSNGKPLKSSLKSSSSTPNVAGDFAGGRMGKHLRVQSAPSTPRVHFAEKDAGLEMVKVFHRTGKPASLSKPTGDETETETEAESYPFPSFGVGSSNSLLSSSSSSQLIHEIDSTPGQTSPIPNPSPDPYANIHVETVTLPRTRPPTLRGTVLVRNIAFEKHVAVRFTLDDWQTTSEVTCKHVVSLPGLPPPFPRARNNVGDVAARIAAGEKVDDDSDSEPRPTWDRFSFTIRLEDYEAKLADRTLYLVARYLPNNGLGNEFWDNNASANYRIAFRRATASPLPSPSRVPFATTYERAAPASQSASQNGLSELLTSANASRGLPGLNAQQRTFSAPSSMRFTPVTGAVPVVSRVAATGTSELPASSTVPTSTSLSTPLTGAQDEMANEIGDGKAPIERDVEALRGAVPLVRRHSSPHQRPETPHFPMPPPIIIPRSQSQPHSPTGPSPQGTAGAYIARRLSLSNYVAPSVGAAKGGEMGMATPPTTPPRESGGLPEVVGEREERRRERDVEMTTTSPVSPPQQLIGGHPATTMETLTFVRPVPSSSSATTTAANPASHPSSSSIATYTAPSIARSSSLDSDESKSPFSPLSRKAPDAFPTIGSLQQLVSPPVSRQGSEDGSGQCTPVGTSSPRRGSPPPRRGSPSKLDLPDLSVAFAKDVERVRAQASPSRSRSPSPTLEASASSTSTQGMIQPPSQGEGKVDTSDSSYAAFVRQWCFAQSTPPTPGVISASPSASSSGPSPMQTPIPPISSAASSLGGVGSSPSSFAALGLGVSSNGTGSSGSNGVGPRRQMGWAAEHQVGAGSGVGLGGGYGFPAFGFATGRHAHGGPSESVSVVGGKHLSPAFAWGGNGGGVVDGYGVGGSGIVV